MKLRHLFLHSILGIMTLSTPAAMLTGSLLSIQAAGEAKQTSSGIVNPGFGEGEGVIKIKGPEGQELTGRTFNLFKVLLATGSGENVAYTIPDETVRSALKTALAEAGKGTGLDNDGKIIAAIEDLGSEAELEPASNAQFRKFVDALRTALNDQAVKIEVNDLTASNEIEIKPLPLGYYLLDETTEHVADQAASSLCMITTAASQAELTLKSEKTDLDMTGEDEDGQPSPGDPSGDFKHIVDLQIGEEVSFKTTLTLPKPGTYTNYPLTLKDTLAKELSFDPQAENLTVKIGETVLNQGDDFTFSTSGGDGEDIEFTLNFADIHEKITTDDGDLTVEFRATLNEKAAENLASGFKNSMEATYPVDPDNPTTTKTSTTETTVYTYGLSGKKTDMETNALAGAEFALYKDKDGSEEIKLSKSSEKVYPNESGSEKIVSADSTGAFNLVGLDAGTYYLKETKAPDGFYPIEGMIELKITPTYAAEGITALSGTATYIDPSSNTSQANALSGSHENKLLNLEIKNKKGGLLPSTGSSLMLIGLAGLVGLLATSFYLSKEKKGKNSKKSKGKRSKEGSLDTQTRNTRKSKSLSFDCTIEPLDCTKEEMLKLLQEKAREVSQEKERKERQEKIEQMEAAAQASEQYKEAKEAVNMEGDDDQTEEEETEDEQAEPQAQEAEDAAVKFDLEKSRKEH